MICEHCATFSGRKTKGAPCCELRALAEMPKAQRQAVYEAKRKEDGESAVKALAQAVSQEYQRRVAFNAAKPESAKNAACGGLTRPKI